MAEHGPGKYDKFATHVRDRTGASTVVVIVLGGTKGSGFSVQSDDAGVGARLPALLRELANQIEAVEAEKN